MTNSGPTHTPLRTVYLFAPSGLMRHLSPKWMTGRTVARTARPQAPAPLVEPRARQHRWLSRERSERVEPHQPSPTADQPPQQPSERLVSTSSTNGSTQTAPTLPTTRATAGGEADPQRSLIARRARRSLVRPAKSQPVSTNPRQVGGGWFWRPRVPLLGDAKSGPGPPVGDKYRINESP